MQSWRIVRGLFTFSLVVSAFLAAGLVYRFHSELAGVALLLALLLAAAAGWAWIPSLKARRAALGALVALAVVELFVVVPELALRFCEYSYESGIEFGYPRPRLIARFVPDAELFWKLPSSMPHVNSLGFPGDEVPVPKPAATFRCLFLGDSCSTLHEGLGYPTLVAERLRGEPALEGTRFESVVLAVSGYSSHQGRVLAQRHAAALEPDLAFVYFGWNDHWAAYGAVDADKQVTVNDYVRVLEGPRVLQALRELVDGARGANRPLGQVRVPIERYEENLSAIAQAFSELGVPLVFITAPTSHVRLGVPYHLLEMGFAADSRSIVELHRKYNQVVRAVAARTRAGLLDLEAEMEALDGIEELFTADGIHFTSAGNRWIAARVSASVLETSFSGGD